MVLKKIIFILFSSMLFCSCASFNTKIIPIGEYYYKGTALSVKLQINSDSTFIYERITALHKSVCKGNWKIISKNKILLNCNDTIIYSTPMESFLFPPLDLSDEKIKILNNNKMKINNMILRRSE